MFDRILNVMRCGIWYHLHNLKNVKNVHGRVLILVKLYQKWYQTAQPITNITKACTVENTEHGYICTP